MENQPICWVLDSRDYEDFQKKDKTMGFQCLKAIDKK